MRDVRNNFVINIRTTQRTRRMKCSLEVVLTMIQNMLSLPTPIQALACVAAAAPMLAMLAPIVNSINIFLRIRTHNAWFNVKVLFILSILFLVI